MPLQQASIRAFCAAQSRVLVAAGLDRITRRAHTLSQLLEDGVSIRAADMPGADDLMMRVYAAMAQKEPELISEHTPAALAAAKARGKALGGDKHSTPMVSLNIGWAFGTLGPAGRLNVVHRYAGSRS